MSSGFPNDNNCEDQNPVYELTKHLVFPERHGGAPEDVPTNALVDEFLNSAHGPNLSTFHTGELFNEVMNFSNEAPETIEPQPEPPFQITHPPPPPPPPPLPFHPGFMPPFPGPLEHYFHPNPVTHPIYGHYPMFPPPVFVDAPPPMVGPPPQVRPFAPFEKTFEFRCTFDDAEGSGPGATKIHITKKGDSSSLNNGAEKKENNEKEKGSSTPQTFITFGKISHNPKEKSSFPDIRKWGSPIDLNIFLDAAKASMEASEMWKCDCERAWTGGVSQPTNKSSDETQKASKDEESTSSDASKDIEEDVRAFLEEGEKPKSKDLETNALKPSKPEEDVKDPFNEGMKFLCSGNGSEATKWLEKAIGKPEAFDDHGFITRLGLGVSSFAQDHYDDAINFLREYLETEKNEHALMILAMCYANEKKYNLTNITLWEWLSHNSKYSDLVDISPPQDMYDESSPLNMDFHQKLTEAFLIAANKNPTKNIDPDVQHGLGILFSTIKDYEKAYDCFSLATKIVGHDEVIWNHLGESLLNMDRYQEAVKVFQSALKLRSNYSIARYNLGVALSKLGFHVKAVQQFLKALQAQAKTQKGLHSKLCETIWEAIKTEWPFVVRPDLDEYLENRDLEKLSKAFGIDVKMVERMCTSPSNGIGRFISLISDH